MVSHAAWQLQFRPRDKRTTIFFKWASRSTGRQTLGRPPRFLLCNELCRLLYTDSIKRPLTLAHQGAGLTGLTGVGLTGLTGAGLTGLKGFEGHPCSDAQAHQSKANEGAGLTGLTRAGAHAQRRSLHCLQCKDGFGVSLNGPCIRSAKRRTPVRPTGCTHCKAMQAQARSVGRAGAHAQGRFVKRPASHYVSLLAFAWSIQLG